jgi:hypothetical protein
MSERSTLVNQFIDDEVFRHGAATGLGISSLDKDPALRFFDSVRGVVMSSFDHAPPVDEVPPSIFIRSERSRADALRIGDAKELLTSIKKSSRNGVARSYW